MTLHGIGKLYRLNSDKPLTQINYTLFIKENGDGNATGWWGELLMTEKLKISDGDGYLIEIEQGHRGRISLRKKINKATMGVPPRYYYHFTGNGELAK